MHVIKTRNIHGCSIRMHVIKTRNIHGCSIWKSCIISNAVLEMSKAVGRAFGGS